MAETDIVKQIADKIKDSNNVLVTVNANPSVDELSAALGITLFINKLDKHATAVFSGATPSAIEFLEPEKTFENTVDSLRDFIIALDKEKADHLRYKVVDDMVKIFITPYRTTISEADLDFSQGDYNVEVVLAIGVKSEADLDKALESHGRIMHDATVAAITLGEPTKLGGLEWADGSASSYSEMLMGLVDKLKTDKAKVDEQISTAFLTGIVSATERFSNASTSSNAMTVAAQLMSAGANQQLIATQLQKDGMTSQPIEEVEPETAETVDQDKSSGDIGSLSISHEPQGNVEEVTKQINESNSNRALEQAKEELERTRTEAISEPTSDAAEQKLAEQLAATSPSVGAPMTASLPDVSEQNSSLRGAVSMDRWKKDDSPSDEPSLGGTLNATTEQAADDKRRAIEDDRNRTILSHNTGYVEGEPSFQAPINAVGSEGDAEPKVADIFASGPTQDITAHAEAIQPPAPVTPHEPTLAEIDAQNRSHDDAKAAIDAAFDNPLPPAPLPPAPVTPENSLPPLPPMPDFSTLPPLPSDLPPAVAPPYIADLASAAPPPPTTPDPAQFRIPGQ